MVKYRDPFRRSDYQIAIHNYRKARRRGDAADAQRWLKAADMHLQVAHRFDEGVHRSLVRDRELAEKRTRDRAEEERSSKARAGKSLEDELNEMEEIWRREIQESEQEEISAAEGSASAGETSSRREQLPSCQR